MKNKELGKNIIYGFGLNIFNSPLKILKLKIKLRKNKQLSAEEYATLSDWYGMFSIFPKTELFYALKAIRADRDYAPAYTLAADGYYSLNTNDFLIEKYLKKALELGGEKYYLPKLILFSYYMDNGLIGDAYNIGTSYFNNKVDFPEYWAISAFIASVYYGYGIEYKGLLQKYMKCCLKRKELPKTVGIIFIIISIYTIIMSLYSKKVQKSTGSIILNALAGESEYEIKLALANKLIIREKRNSQKTNESLACLYLIKSASLVYKEEREYEKAIETLEYVKKYGGKTYLDDYYYMRANFAYVSDDIQNAIKYVNQAMLYKTDSRTLLLRGYILKNIDKLDEALECFNKALEYGDCNKSSAYFNMADILLYQEKYKDALDNINQALLIEQNRIFYYIKAGCLEKLGHRKEAQKYYDKYDTTDE